MNGIRTFTITSHTYYDQYSQNYRNILMVNVEPPGPLRLHIRPLKLPRLSPFFQNNARNNYIGCGLAIVSLRRFFLANQINSYSNQKGGFDLMTPDEIPFLITFLESHGYQIDTQITNMLNQSEVKLTDRKLVFNVTYYGEGNKPNIVYIR
jgi:hypothetical protein